MDVSTIQLILEKVFQYGIFGALFVGLLTAVGYGLWKIGNRISDHIIKTLTTISETNTKYADSSLKMVDLVEILKKQTESTLDQLKYIKASLNRQSSAVIELMKISSTMNKEENKELELRIESVIRELQRPVDD